MEKGIYAYCVVGTNEKRNLGPMGIGGQGDEVYTIPYEDIAAVVSDVSIVSFHTIPRETLIRYLVDHQFVIERAMESYTVIPLKFGTIISGGVQEVLKQSYCQFKSVLKSMDGKIELDVVVLWSDLNSVLQEIGTRPEIRKFKQEMAAKSGPTHEDRIKVGKMVKTELDEVRNELAKELIDKLKGHAIDFCLHEALDDSMIMNVAFLIDRGREREFDQRVNELDEKYGGKVNFRIVGPLPPYSFCTLEVERVEFEEVDEARKILGLAEEASMFTIKKAYRELLREYHPDKNPSEVAQEQFKKVSEAHRILTDYCEHYKYSFKPEDVKNFLVIKFLESGKARLSEGQKHLYNDR